MCISWTVRIRTDNAASNAFDGNPATFWHTAWISGATPPPHVLQIDLGQVQPVSGFRYLPRQDNYQVGNIAEYEFYTSMDGVTWGSPAASGTFASSKTEKQVLFSARDARYVELRCVSEVNGGNDCNVAELNVLRGGDSGTGNQSPVANAGSASTSEDTPKVIALSASDPDGDLLNLCDREPALERKPFRIRAESNLHARREFQWLGFIHLPGQ